MKLKVAFTCEMWLFNGAFAPHTLPSHIAPHFYSVSVSTESQLLLVSARRSHFSCRTQLIKTDPEEGDLHKCIMMCPFKPLLLYSRPMKTSRSTVKCS